ncbi:MAG: riboflavin synthase, partial [Actinobacteria bacterium]|nr:riboflavin synthase [Actinomycetota bacterium]
MFTGIVEEMGTVREVRHGSKSSILTIKAGTVLEGTRVGDSIATNGVCLTVTSLAGEYFKADVMAETVRRTNLSELRAGDRVNLERALRLQDRLGGHLVSGHIDGLGRVARVSREDNATWVTIAAEPGLLRYVLERGSIAVDGVSLTVARLTSQGFSVSLIPHTGDETILLSKHPGDTVNLECDLIGKYVERLLGFG